MGKVNGWRCCLFACIPACPLVQVCRLFDASGPAGGGSGPLVVCSVPLSLLLSAFLLCLWCAMLKHGSISRFKGVFRGFCGVCVGLFVLRALRGLWGFCARVELGGLEACGVFAFLFLLLSLCLLSFYALCLLCSGCLSLSSCLVFTFLICLCYFFFPCGICAKREGAKVLLLASSLACCGLLLLFRFKP